MKRLAKVILGIVLVNAVLVGIARLVRRRIPSYGDETSDSFALVAIMDGVEFASSAPALSEGRATAVFGGIDLDLTAAQPAPAARLEVLAALGGVRIVVDPGWRVAVESTARMGGVETALTPDEELPEDAPALLIRATATLGGVMVTVPH